MSRTRQIHTRLLLLLGIAFLFVFGMSMRVHAYSYKIEQSGVQKTGIPIRWTKPNDKVVKYIISAGDDSSSARQIATLDANATSYTVPAEAGSKKYIRVEYIEQGSSSQYTYRLGYTDEGVTLPTKVTKVNQKKWWRFILHSEVGWKRVENATGYKITFRNSKNKVIKTETTKYNPKEPSSTLTKVKNNMIYTVVVQAYTTVNGRTYWGEPSDKAYLFTSPEVRSSRVKGGKLKVTWAPVAGATGYDIYVSTSAKKGYKKVKTIKGGNKKSATIKKFKKKKFKSGKKYYVYVVTRKKVGGRTYTSGSEYYWRVGQKSIQWL
ncbi:MAG: hypothetical protein IJI10_11005 [Eubacterium sp.]|nr:hypothetical protein [Eubacterium sp.]